MYSFEETEIRCPEEVGMQLMPSLTYAYGAAHTLAKYCGFEESPYVPRGLMQHGWIRDYTLIHPAMAIWDDGESTKNDYHWVNRKEVEGYLRSVGYKNAHATGLAIQYTPEIEVPRLKNSLLVMPLHSLYTSEHQWGFKEYCDEIIDIAKDFDAVAVSVHPACKSKGYWKEFEEAGFDIIEGALFSGANALARTRWLMSRFEHVTTNCTGTCIAYAAAYGAKPSFYGTYIDITQDDIPDDGLYKTYPELKDLIINANSRKSLEAHYPFLFCGHPKEAKELLDWGQFQIGVDDKRSPEEIRELLGWPGRASSVHMGEEVEVGPTRGKEWPSNLYETMDRAVEGSVEHCLLLGTFFEFGLWYNYRSIDEAIYWYRQASSSGSDLARVKLAHLLISHKQDEANMATIFELLDDVEMSEDASLVEIGKLLRASLMKKGEGSEDE